MKYPVNARRIYNNSFFCKILFNLWLALSSSFSFVQLQGNLPSPAQLKKLTLEELLNIEVTSVSKHPEQLKQAASAIQVITQKNIGNAGAKTLTEALRLVQNLQVAQVNLGQWLIYAREFNQVLLQPA